MAKPKHVACAKCFLGQEHVLKRTFLGFHKFTCTHCETKNQYPLSMGYAVIYGIASLLCVVFLLLGAIPGCVIVLGVGGFFALGFDLGIRRRAKHALANEKTRDQVLTEPFE